MGNVHMEAAQINYRGGEKKMSVEEALKTTSGEAAAIAQLQSDVADLNSDKANKTDIATEFSDLTNYNAGDLVYYEGDLYEFQFDHTAGAWETSEVNQKDLSDIVTTLKSGLTSVDSRLPIYAKSSIYAGDGSFTVTISDDSTKHYFFVFGIKNTIPFYFVFSVNTEHTEVYSSDNTITGVIANKTTITISGIGNYSNVTVISPREFS